MDKGTRYDVVVIGAGLAGLSCAAHLAKAGRRVALFEQHSSAGGLWTSFSLSGKLFDLGFHWVRDPRPLNKMLEALGADPVEFMHLESLVRLWGPPSTPGRAIAANDTITPRAAAAAPAWNIPVGADVKAFVSGISDSFPTVPKDTVEHLVKSAVEVSRDVEHQRRTLRSRLLSRTPAARYFARLFPQPELAGLRTACQSLLPLPGASATDVLSVLGLGLRGKTFAPRQGAQALVDAFVRAATMHGAELFLGEKVEALLTQDGQIRGVRLSQGCEVEAAAVVVAGDLLHTLYRLLGWERVPSALKRRLQVGQLSNSCAIASLVTTLDPEAFGFDGTPVMVSPPADMPEALLTWEPQSCPYLLVFPRQTGAQSDAATRAVQIVTPADFLWEGNWRSGDVQPPSPGYYELKKDWARRIIERVQVYLPKLGLHIKAMEVSTPISLHGDTLNTCGAAFGWSLGGRPVLPQQLPFLKGLYLAGHWVGPPGALAVTQSGLSAAQLILRH